MNEGMPIDCFVELVFEGSKIVVVIGGVDFICDKRSAANNLVSAIYDWLQGECGQRSVYGPQ